jgi:hypothetical protein
MREGGQPVPPAIVVISCGARTLDDQVLAGIEEEGVPAVLQRCSTDDDAHSLARAAALGSSLGVGVGIDSRGAVSVQHEQLAGAVAGLHSGPVVSVAAARTLGHNAARIVVGIPLRTVAS